MDKYEAKFIFYAALVLVVLIGWGCLIGHTVGRYHAQRRADDGGGRHCISRKSWTLCPLCGRTQP
ncbi:hypothetical protein LCGC14_0755100 [marine sediment metagenome]|uniref:Uncharacterized protein n=1 Tax=marine sediment metagenome TaxID=412755 RepID=A0A0F9SN18_9ZZZZ